MGLLDKFKKRFERVGKEKRTPKHVVKEDHGGLTKAELEVAKSIEAGRASKAEGEKRPSRVKEKVIREDTKRAPAVLIRPIVSEKATQLAGQRKYTFAVAKAANAVEIRKAIRALYGVEPTSVNVLNVRGKDVMFGRVRGRTTRWKKAIVTLGPGEKIDVYA